jgi:hypothetical protein
MNRKSSIWDKLSDLELFEGAIEEIKQCLALDDAELASAMAFLLQLKARLVKKQEERP